MHNRNGMDTQKGTMWFTFYTKVRPWLSCVSILPALALFIRFREICMSQWWLLLLFLAAVAEPILGVIVFVKSRKDYEHFVRFVNVVLIFEALNLAYSQAVLWFVRTEYNTAVALVVGAVFLLLGYFLWYRLNIQYFKKRIIKTTAVFGGEDGQFVECTACGYRYKSSLPRLRQNGFTACSRPCQEADR